jgi:hypothetical protein
MPTGSATLTNKKKKHQKKHFPAEKSQVNSSKYEKVDGWKFLALSSSRF